nr:MAG TPA: hypothetical protein [Caudoviricetes sp.]
MNPILFLATNGKMFLKLNPQPYNYRQSNNQLENDII